MSEIFRKIFLDGLLYKLSIKRRFVIYYLLFFIVPALIIFYVCTSFLDILAEKNQAIIEAGLDSAEQIVSTELNNAINLLKVISYNEIIEESFLHKQLSHSEKNMLDKILNDYQGMLNAEGIQKAIITLYSENMDTIIDDMGHNRLRCVNELNDEVWFDDFSRVNDQYTFVSSKTPGKKGERKENTIRVVKKIKQRDLSFPGIYLSYDIPAKYLSSKLSDFKPTENSCFWILDKEGDIVIRSDIGMLGITFYMKDQLKNSEKGKFTGKYENRKVEFIYNNLNAASDWFILCITPYSDLHMAVEYRNYTALVFFLVILFGGLLFILLAYSDIQEPINKILFSIKEVKNGNFRTYVEYHRRDEFLLLKNEYLEMMYEVRGVIDKLLVMEKNKMRAELSAKESEMKALQAQINPHFLYNTLDSINWLAIKYKAKDISHLIKSLADFFRYSLSKGNDFITIEEEIRQVESYLYIHKVRFGNKLDYSISIEPEALKCYTIKLVLQPFVENCIIHAFQNVNVKGIIYITASVVEKDIEICIIDNGVGADVDKLEQIVNDKSYKSHHYGIRNVNDRICQCFGQKYRVNFNNNNEGGTTVIIRIPVIKVLEEYYAKNDYSRR